MIFWDTDILPIWRLIYWTALYDTYRVFSIQCCFPGFGQPSCHSTWSFVIFLILKGEKPKRISNYRKLYPPWFPSITISYFNFKYFWSLCEMRNVIKYQGRALHTNNSVLTICKMSKICFTTYRRSVFSHCFCVWCI